MPRGYLKIAQLCGAFAAVSCLVNVGAHAADLAVKAPSPPPDSDFWTRPDLFGDLGRSKLQEQGISLSLSIWEEAVGNVSGGLKNNTAQEGLLSFGAKFDMQKLAGVQGGLVGLSIAAAHYGQNLNTTAQIPALELTNELFGRGNIPRLAELYYQQTLLNGALQFKAGRLTIGSDFSFANCDFINLTFCASQPGNIMGGVYIFNYPASQWGGLVRTNVAKDLQFTVGVYDSNPNYEGTDTATVWGGFPAATPVDGVLVPFELTWTPHFGPLSGTWRLGGWYDNTSSIDSGLPGIVNTFVLPATCCSDGPIAINQSDQRGRYGAYESIWQRLTAEGHGPQGWYAFLNTTVADHRTSFKDYQTAFGVQHKGTFSSRPDDEIGFAVGTTHVNSAAVANPNAGGNEVPFEAWYGWQAAGWLNLKFDVQYVVNPGGNGYTQMSNGAFVKTSDAWIFGLRTAINF